MPKASTDQTWGRSPTVLGWAGAAGTAAIAASSYWVGAIPVYFRADRTPVVDLMGVGAFPARIVFYLGVAALSGAWLLLGRLVLDVGLNVRVLRRIALVWATPLLFAIPLSSRDLWAYAAQGQLVLHHLDPYRLGPSARPSWFSIEVSHRWVSTPTPYGPLWLLLSRFIAGLLGPHVGLTVATLRLVAASGLVLTAFALPVLARRTGARPDLALWLVVANPLTLILGLGGGHNDLLMVGLMTSGLAIICRKPSSLVALGLGAVVLTAAVAVKSPAAIVLGFAVPLWLTLLPDRAERVRKALAATALVVGTAILTFGVITAASGLGLGWMRQVNASSSVVSWMSLPSLAAILTDLFSGRDHHALKLDPQMTQFRTVGTALSIAILALLWLIAMRNALDSRRRWVAAVSPWTLLSIAMLSVVLLGPSVQPWYFIWGLAIVVLTPVGPRFLAVSAGLSLGMVIMIRPNGVGLQMNPSVVALLGLPVLLASAVLLPEVRSALIKNEVRVRQAVAGVLRGDRARADQRQDQDNDGRREQGASTRRPVEQGVHAPREVDLGRGEGRTSYSRGAAHPRQPGAGQRTRDHLAATGFGGRDLVGPALDPDADLATDRP